MIGRLQCFARRRARPLATAPDESGGADGTEIGIEVAIEAWSPGPGCDEGKPTTATRRASLRRYGHFTTGGIDDRIESTLPPEQKKRLEHFREGRKRWLQKQIEKQKEQGR